jgi:hypothetical protein
MQLVSLKPVIGIARHLDSFAGWAFLTGVAVVPPLVVMWRWNDPRPTMSESIQEVLR